MDSHLGFRGCSVSLPQRYDAPDIGLTGWSRWIWRQLTSMRTALILLLLLAAAAVPGSIYPQRSADPNGVSQFFDNNPELASVLDFFPLFDVYGSIWFSVELACPIVISTAC